MSYYSRLSDDLDYVKVFNDETISKEDKFIQTHYENDNYNIFIKNNLTYKNYIKFKNNIKVEKSVLILKILTLLSLLGTFISSILLLLNGLDSNKKIIQFNEYSIKLSFITFIILDCLFIIIYLVLVYINHNQ